MGSFIKREPKKEPSIYELIRDRLNRIEDEDYYFEPPSRKDGIYRPPPDFSGIEYGLYSEEKGSMLSFPRLTQWKTLSKKLLLDLGKFLRVESHEVQLPDGSIIPDWSFLVGPDAAIVLAETVDKKYLCFHQVRYAIKGETLAAIGGHVEKNEDPLMAAVRELREETGYEADNWTHLGTFMVDPSRGLGKRHLYFARGAIKIAEPNSDDLEEQHLLELTRSELEEASREGMFKVGSWAALVALSLNLLYQEERT